MMMTSYDQVCEYKEQLIVRHMFFMRPLAENFKVSAAFIVCIRLFFNVYNPVRVLVNVIHLPGYIILNVVLLIRL